MSTEPKTVTTHIRDEAATAILERQGWERRPIRGGSYYVRPGGKRREDGGQFGTDWLWERDEAVHNAIEEMAIGQTPERRALEQMNDWIDNPATDEDDPIDAMIANLQAAGIRP